MHAKINRKEVCECAHRVDTESAGCVNVVGGIYGWRVGRPVGQRRSRVCDNDATGRQVELHRCGLVGPHVSNVIDLGVGSAAGACEATRFVLVGVRVAATDVGSNRAVVCVPATIRGSIRDVCLVRRRHTHSAERRRYRVVGVADDLTSNDRCGPSSWQRVPPIAVLKKGRIRSNVCLSMDASARLSPNGRRVG